MHRIGLVGYFARTTLRNASYLSRYCARVSRLPAESFLHRTVLRRMFLCVAELDGSYTRQGYDFFRSSGAIFETNAGGRSTKDFRNLGQFPKPIGM
jgi:hypothetical protein